MRNEWGNNEINWGRLNLRGLGDRSLMVLKGQSDAEIWWSNSNYLGYSLGVLKAELFGCFSIQKDLMEIANRHSRKRLLFSGSQPTVA